MIIIDKKEEHKTFDAADLETPCFQSLLELADSHAIHFLLLPCILCLDTLSLGRVPRNAVRRACSKEEQDDEHGDRQLVVIWRASHPGVH